MNSTLAKALRQTVDTGTPIDGDSALSLLQSPPDEMAEILALSDTVRRRFCSSRIHLCSIFNAKCGECTEDCAFCAQSSRRAGPPLPGYGMLPAKDIREGRRAALRYPISHFSIVTSGKDLAASEFSSVIDLLRLPIERGPTWCASLGCLPREQLAQLREAGLRRYHHSLETAPSYFPHVCTTHPYEDRLRTIRDAADVGLEVCCGGVLGMGESLAQRVEFALQLAREHIDSIPLNFLIPIPGTPLGSITPIPARDILLAIAMVRFTNPKTPIQFAAGRRHLHRLQALIFQAGCTGVLIGDLLTTLNENPEDDLQMLRDLQLIVDTPQ